MRPQSFFECVYDFYVLPGMTRTGTDVGKPELAKNDTHVTFMEFDAKPFLDDALEFNPSPPYDTVPCRIGLGFNDPGMLRRPL